MTRIAWALAVAAVVPLLAGCGGPPSIHVQVNVITTGFSGGNITVEAWDPGNSQVVDVNTVLGPGQNVTVGSFDARAGDYMVRGMAGINARVQENIALTKGTPMLYVLASDSGVQFSLDGRTPL